MVFPSLFYAFFQAQGATLATSSSYQPETDQMYLLFLENPKSWFSI